MTSYVFITGGVVSSLGKGITSAVGEELFAAGADAFVGKTEPPTHLLATMKLVQP